MARSRNIKPSFFTNDLLADIDPLGRLLFIGLWTLADCNGNLEWRPRRIKAQLLAYDDADVTRLVLDLDRSGFVRFYSDGEEIFIHIVNFDRHQNPHKNEREKGVDIPEYTEELRQLVDLKNITINRDLSRAVPESSQSDPADSLLLIPDSLLPNSGSTSTETAEDETHLSGEPDQLQKKKPSVKNTKPKRIPSDTSQPTTSAGSQPLTRDQAHHILDEFRREISLQPSDGAGPESDREMPPVVTMH